MVIPFYIIPIILTIIFLIIMFRPYQYSGDYDIIGPIFRIFWSIPILIVWCIYFAILAFK